MTAELAPSFTARVVAAHRLAFDRVITPFGDPSADDRLARDVAGRSGVSAADDRMARYLRARTLFFDQAVVRALQRGVAQVMVIGAGYDGRSMRYGKPGVRWFEVDHPSTQGDKRARMVRLGIASPRVTYVALDLRAGALASALTEAGWTADRDSLILCEGVSVYLDEAVLAGMLVDLRAIVSPETTLAISLATSPRSAEQHARRGAFLAAVQAIGEPARNMLSADNARELFAAAGWQLTGATERGRRAGLVVATPC